MTEIQIQAANRAIILLRAAGVDYKVILPDGTEHGDLEVVVHKKRTRTQRVPSGSLMPLYKSKLDAAQIGDVVQISIEDAAKYGATPEGMRSSITAYANNLWGKGSYTSTVTDTHVELLRIS